jgi:hypothetical protein
MANSILTHVWTGRSGIQYTYNVYPIGFAFPEKVVGNYIFVRYADREYHPVYIGEGILAERCSGKHHQAKCIVSKGAILIHAHPNTVDLLRKGEETDLLAAYPQAYAPIGCNEKPGG